MKKVFLMMTAFCVMLTVFSSCDEEISAAEFREKQINDSIKEQNAKDSIKECMISRAMDAYLLKNIPDNQALKKGVNYCFYKTNEGDLPKIGDVIEFTWASTMNDSLELIPISENMTLLMKPQFKNDIMEGLAMMHIGDSASFFVDAETVFTKMIGYPSLPESIDATNVVRFDIRMNDFYPESEFENKMKEKGEKAKESFQKYIKDNKIKAKPTSTGLYYVVTKKGSGAKPSKGDKVKVHYTGKLLDGTVFDSSVEQGEPIEVQIGVGYVIPGWDEGIVMMSKGEKGVLYIPYDLAYGERGAGGVIPPFANLIFEVELIDFQKAQ